MGASKSKDNQCQIKLPKFYRARKDLDLTICPARIDKVHVAGLSRTTEDYVQRVASRVFRATNFQDVIVECTEAWASLNELGIYKDLRVQIDVSQGANASPNGYEVSFIGTELPRVVGAVGTEVGQNEGSMTFDLTTPNVLGRGERATLHGSYSNSKRTDLTLRISKPYLHTVLGDYKPEVAVEVFRQAAMVPISAYKTENFGMLAEFKMLFPLNWRVSHSFQYEMSFRELYALGKQSPFFISQNCGPRMASLLRHIASIDMRDNRIFPTRGAHMKCTTEYCGLGGNLSYLLGNLHAEVSFPLFAGLSAQFVGRAGVIRNIGKNQPEPPISSLFTLGGPLTLRGFQFGGVGPHCDGYAMGMHSYWATAFHLWAPLPFYSYLGRFGDNFRSHLFYNFGNCDSFSVNNLRAAAGFGVAMRIGERARIECNYCYPLNKEKNDRTQPGLQFGIGYEFI